MVATVTPLRTPDAPLEGERIVALYKHMVLARALDERLVQLQKDGKLASHLSAIGEEATILGGIAGIREQDWVFHYGREAAGALFRGMPLASYLSHVFGSSGDGGKGRQMPGTFASRAARFASASAPIGTQITHAVGFAWAAKTKKDDVVALACFGEGATSSGDFHTGLNFAGVFKAPVVFLCRNNGWAISVPADRQTAASSFSLKGIAYGVPGVAVDGNDLFAVHKAVAAAVARASRGEGATLIEATTSRKTDPIVRVREHLEGRRLWSDKDEAELAARVRSELDVAIALAQSEPPPPRESMFDDVYRTAPWHLHEEREELRKCRK